jgi:hypothetical protein
VTAPAVAQPRAAARDRPRRQRIDRWAGVVEVYFRSTPSLI